MPVNRDIDPVTTGEVEEARAAGSSAPACSPPPYELACRMLNAIGWNGNDFRLRDPVALAIAPEVERINRRANAALKTKAAEAWAAAEAKA